MKNIFNKIELTVLSEVRNSYGYLTNNVAQLMHNGTGEVVCEVEFLCFELEKLLVEGNPLSVMSRSASADSEFSTAFSWLSKHNTYDYRTNKLDLEFHDSVKSHLENSNKEIKRNVIFIKELKVKPRFLGKGFGEYLLKFFPEHYGKNFGLMVLQACPLQLCSHLRSSYQYRTLGMNPEKSREKLLQWYSSKGLIQIEEDHMDWMFCTTEDLDEIDANIGNVVTIDKRNVYELKTKNKKANRISSLAM